MRTYHRTPKHRALFLDDLRRNALPIGMLILLLLISHSVGQASGRKRGIEESKGGVESMGKCMEPARLMTCEHLLKGHAH